MRDAPWLGLAVLALLVGIVLLQLTGPLQPSSLIDDSTPLAPTPDNKTSRDGRSAPVTLAGLEEFASIGDRPLFMRTRRPPEPPPPEVPATTPPAAVAKPLANVSVQAIVRDGDRWLAVLTSGKGGTAEQATPGSRVFGWEVTAIHPQAVELRNGARNVRLELRPETTAKRR